MKEDVNSKGNMEQPDWCVPYGHSSGDWRELIKDGVDVNVRNSKGDTALISVCKNRNSKAAKNIIDSKTDINAVDACGNTPLMLACMGGMNDVAKKLIEKGVDVNVTDGFGNTPLMWACENNMVDVVESLLAREAKIGDKVSVFAYTFRGKNKMILKILIEQNKDLNKAFEKIRNADEYCFFKGVVKEYFDDNIKELDESINNTYGIEKRNKHFVKACEALARVNTCFNNVEKIILQDKRDEERRRWRKDLKKELIESEHEIFKATIRLMLACRRVWPVADIEKSSIPKETNLTDIEIKLSNAKQNDATGRKIVL